MKYFTADNHFSHQKIIQYCGRPWKDYKAMNASMISKWNDVVTPTDTVYMLGDIFLGSHHNELTSILNRLNGSKHLILGNHDLLTPWQYVDCGIITVHTHLSVVLCNGETFNLHHDPAPACGIKQFNPNRWLCGHVHNIFEHIDNRIINVGVDVHNFTPISEEYIIETYKETI